MRACRAYARGVEMGVLGLQNPSVPRSRARWHGFGLRCCLGFCLGLSFCLGTSGRGRVLARFWLAVLAPCWLVFCLGAGGRGHVLARLGLAVLTRFWLAGLTWFLLSRVAFADDFVNALANTSVIAFANGVVNAVGNALVSAVVNARVNALVHALVNVYR